jgi:hypothetical protein
MRLTLLVALGLMAIYGCSRSNQPELAPLAGSLARAWPRANPDLDMTMRAEKVKGHVILHCTLKNTSVAAVALNHSRLPWTAPAWLNVDALTADGKLTARPRAPAAISVLEAGPSKIVLDPSASLEGDIDLATGPIVPLIALPKDRDLLILWSYSLDVGNPSKSQVFSGITFLGGQL